jgi:hypothetical protein
MKLTAEHFTQEIYHELSQLWSNTDPERPDYERGIELLDHMLFDDGGASVWYVVPPSGVFVLTDIKPGFGANFTPVALYTVDAETAKAELRSVMREYDLRRLTAFAPAPILAGQRNLHQLGFVEEGRLRDGTTYDSSFTDMVVLGLHRSSVEYEVPLPIAGPAGRDVGKKRRRRRRRSRRKKKVTETNA